MLRALALLLASAAVAPRAHAQGGYTTEKHPALGLEFPRARDYEQIPTQPDEEFIVLYFAEKVGAVQKKEDKGRRASGFRPELNVVWIDEVPDRKPETSGAPAPPGPGPQPEKKPEEKPEAQGGSASAADAAKGRIDSLERWVERRLRQFELGASKEGRTKKGWAAREYELKFKPLKGRPSEPIQGWVYAWRGPGRTIAFVGFADQADFERSRTIWRESAERVAIDEPEEQSTAKLERKYANSKLKDPAFRIAVRRKLVRGWKAEDTENFIVVYDTPDQPLVRKILSDLETIRTEYEKLFPPSKPVVAVSTVRVCKSREEYLSYGGSSGSAGFWNSATEELVFYDAEKTVGGASGADTFIVLYHEAFHQYIHYSTGELPPHSWFNEGHGDYFSGARVGDGKVRGIGPNPWRAGLIQAVVAAGENVPWKDIVLYEQPQYYANPDICYAQGWAMVYFLRTSRVVEKKPEWARILPTYFDTLKQSWGAERARLEAAGKLEDQVEVRKAELGARRRAHDAAFEGVDFAAIDAAWQAFVLDMDLPKRR